MSAPLRIERVDGGSGLDAFIRVPFGLYRDDPNWVPPLLLERRRALAPGGTPYLRRADVALWIARRGGRAVGRISAQIDPLALERDPGTGHFGLIAAEDDPEVFAALLGAAEEWLRARGMERVRGPFNLSINEESGVLVDGFSTPPMLMMPHDPPYLGGRLAAAGYDPVKDILAYRLDPHDVPEALLAVLDRQPPSGVAIRPLRWADYREEVRRLVEIFNDAWCGNWGFVPITGEEIEVMARELRPLIDERLVWFAEADGEAVAFIVCLPNLNEAIADLNGRLWPLGWARLLWRIRMRRLTTARVPLMGVRKRMSQTLLGSALPFLLIGALRREVLKRRVRAVEISWVLEDNRPMRAVAEALCGPAYKTCRLYERALR
ncbi:dATP pyrophosphohydrolase [Oleispirillum naphthae]|uniref:dATP pyrophosphohydrolase n=1 Tax=Oleispirillum naphthae TaxID=2838853 RepID=UPI0030825D3A